jgi:hypothetical protein
MNVLTDPLIAVRVAEQSLLLPLPEVILGLWEGAVTGLPGPTSIQRQYLWRLLVRCAAHARDADVRLLEDAGALRQFLAAAAGGLAAWALHREDDGPAFLQVPARMEGAGPVGFRADDLSRLSIVPGDKNHEFKRGVLSALPGPEVLLALVECQFGAIYTKGNYESQIMAGGSGKGSGSPFMAPWWPDLRRTFRTHVEASCEHAEYAREVLGLIGSIWALWTESWEDDAASVPAQRLTPHFIPLARQIRLHAPDDSGLYSRLWIRPTRARRVTDHTAGSGLGDPFTPFVGKGEGWKVRGVMQDGFHYREIARLLLRSTVESGPNGRPSFAVEYAARATDDALLPVQLEGMAFDQGKTVGFHRRLVNVPTDVVVDPEPVSILVVGMLQDARIAERALVSAIRVWMNGSRKPTAGDRALMERLRQGLTTSIDEAFVELMPTLRALKLDEDLEPRRSAWRLRLEALSARALRRVFESTPVPSASRYERHVAAFAKLRVTFRREGWPLSAAQADVEEEEEHHV